MHIIPSRIDVHAHVWTTEYLDLLKKFGKTDTDTQRGIGATISEEDIKARFELMNKAGVAIQVLSATPQSPHFKNKDHAVKAAQYINNQYAEVVKKWPDRFVAYASLPLPHIEESLIEMKRTLDEFGMLGVCVTTTILDKSPADDYFAPILEELNKRKSVLYIHPEGCGAHCPLIQEHRLTWMVGAPMEDTICVARLISAGIPSRYPDLKIIVGHLGGGIPMLMQRMDNLYEWETPGTPEKPSIAAKRMWYDSVAHGHIPALHAAVETFGADRILLGSDFPYQPVFQRAIDFISEGLSKDDARKILDENAAQVLGIAITNLASKLE